MTRGPKEIYRGSSVKVKRLLDEAVRRWHLQEANNNSTTLTAAWLGLGTKSEYLAGMKAGLFLPIHGLPQPRTNGWWQLTDVGATVVAWLLGVEEGKKKAIQKQ